MFCSFQADFYDVKDAGILSNVEFSLKANCAIVKFFISLIYGEKLLNIFAFLKLSKCSIRWNVSVRKYFPFPSSPFHLLLFGGWLRV